MIKLPPDETPQPVPIPDPPPEHLDYPPIDRTCLAVEKSMVVSSKKKKRRAKEKV